MAATVVAKIGTGATLRLFKCGKKAVEGLGASTGISIAAPAEVSANPIIDTAELMRVRDLIPITGRGTKNGRPAFVRFLCAKDKATALVTEGKVNYDGIEYKNLATGSRRQVLK